MTKIELPDEESEPSEEEELVGVPVKKVSEQAQGNEMNQSPTAVLLGQTELFKGFADQVIAQLTAGAEPRLFRPGEMIYREGERQHWLGILLSGAATVHITATGEAGVGADSFGTSRPEIAAIQEGDMFGEINALRVRETRTATVISDSDCQVVTLEGKVIWAAVDAASGDEKQRLLAEAERWKAFLGSRFAQTCHPEIAYQLRMRSTFRDLAPGEELVFGYCSFNSSLASEQSTHLPVTTAVLETGRILAVSERREMLSAGAVIGDAAVLGVQGAMVISCPEGVCHLACFTREVFWKLIGRFTRERENFTRMALERLPPSTLELSDCPLLAHIQGPQAQGGLARTIQSLVRQRVMHPGAEVCTAEEPDVLSYFQQGSAEVIIADHKVRQVTAGHLCGELGFLGASGRSGVTVRALELCVLQELRRADLEAQLNRHHAIRARLKELSKMKRFLRQDSTTEQQVSQLQRIGFLRGLPDTFLKAVLLVLEERVFFPGQDLRGPSEGTNFMSILLDGSAERKPHRGDPTAMRPGETVGEIGLLSSYCGSKDAVVASTVCYVQVLHHTLLFTCLRGHPEVKRHFEQLAKASMLSKGRHDMQSASSVYSLPFFKDSCRRFLYLLDLHMDRRFFFSDEAIVQEGTTGREMYILYSGTADVNVMETKVGSLSQGQTFGEMALLGLVQKRTATITATSLCDVRIISEESWEIAIKEFPEERHRFETLAAEHQRHCLESKSGGKVRQTSQFFAGCDPGFASAIVDSMEDQLFLEGQALMNEGEKGDWMALLHQGRASVSVNGVKVAELRSGDVIGEMAVMGISSARTATVVAVETCFVQVLHRAQLLPVLEGFPHERLRIRQKAAARLQQRWKGDTVRHLEIFQGCPRVFTDFLDLRTQRWVFFSGDMLCHQGYRGSHMFVLLSGHVDVVSDGEVVAELKGGSVIGEFVALGISQRRTATLRCREICDIYSLSRKDMRAAFEKWPEQNKRLMSLAAMRMRKDIEKSMHKPSLQSCPLFQQCTTKFLECISNHLEDKVYLRGTLLCREGERGDSMFILLNGTFDCIVGNKKVSELTEGSIIGEIAVLGLGTARTATLRAQTTCLVQQLRGPVLMKYLHEFPREMTRFQEVGAARLEQLAVNSESNLFKYQVLFRNCCAEFMDSMTPLLRRKFFFADQVIIQEDSESTEMFAIGQGRAAVERKGKPIGYLEAGMSLGEMAVLGLAPETQTLTVRAEVLCDMQVLSRSAFEPLLEKFPAERARLLDMAAQVMREDFSDVTNFDLLVEVLLLQELDLDVVTRLSRAVVTSVFRIGELLFQPGDTSFFVLLKGAAEVEVEGVPGRLLTEGDTFGEIALLGLAENNNIGVRASRTCLHMGFSQKDFQAAVSKSGNGSRTQLQELLAKLTDTEGMRWNVVERCPIIRSLKLSEEQLTKLSGYCEEVVFASHQEIASRHGRSEVLIFIVTGEVCIGMGKDAIELEAGSSLGELTVSSQHTCGVFAVNPTQALLLHRKAFLAFVDILPGDEQERLHALLQDNGPSPREIQEGKKENVSLTLRQEASMMAEQCFAAAKDRVEANNCVGRLTCKKDACKKDTDNEVWNTAKLRLMLKGTMQGLQEDVPGPTFVDGVDGESGLGSRQLSQESPSQAEAPSTMPDTRVSPSASSPSLKSRTRLTVKEKRLAAAQKQEGLLLRDMQRLADEAKRAAAAARHEQAVLRREAEELRRKLNAVESNSVYGVLSSEDGSCSGREDPRSLPPSPHKPLLVQTDSGSLPSTPRKLPLDPGSLPSTPRKPMTPRPLVAATPWLKDFVRGPVTGAVACAGVVGNAIDSEAVKVALAERRVERLQAKLVKACQRREDLLQQLQQRTGLVCS